MYRHKVDNNQPYDPKGVVLQQRVGCIGILELNRYLRGVRGVVLQQVL